MQDVEASRLPPLISVWVRPRETIERIVAGASGRHILVLAGLGGFAGIASFLIQFGAIAELKDWRLLLGAVLFGALTNIAQLYAVAFLVAWLGRKLGSGASMADVRAALAWGAMPIILGGALVVVIVLSANTPAARSLSEILQVILGVGGLWSIIATLLMLSRILKLGAGRTISVYVVCGLLAPFLLAYAIRTFLFQPFSIPASSMTPALQVGDFVFVNKFSYGYNRYSFPFAPSAFTGRLFAAEPQRGDVVVFALPKDATVYLKRVVGLPGDHIQMKSGQLYLNGSAVPRERLSDYSGSDEPCGEGIPVIKRWRESLPNGVSYETFDCVDNGLFDNTVEYVVPPGHVFAIGDNRDNSTDSRVLSAVGYIPLGSVFGRADMIFFSRAPKPNSSASLRFERMGKIIH